MPLSSNRPPLDSSGRSQRSSNLELTAEAGKMVLPCAATQGDCKPKIHQITRIYQFTNLGRDQLLSYIIESYMFIIVHHYGNPKNKATELINLKLTLWVSCSVLEQAPKS